MALYVPMPPDTKVACPMCGRVYRLGDLKPEEDKVVTCPIDGAAVQAQAPKKTLGEKWR